MACPPPRLAGQYNVRLVPPPLARVVVYSTSRCPWCTRATSLLEERGIAFNEVDAEVLWRDRFRDEIEKITGARTVPQIVIDGRPIGGYEELAALDLDGRLAGLVSSVDPA